MSKEFTKYTMYINRKCVKKTLKKDKNVSHKENRKQGNRKQNRTVKKYHECYVL